MENDNPKIAELIDSYYPCIDGPINVVSNYCTHLNEKAVCKALVPSAGKKANFVDRQPFEILRCKSTGAPEHYRYAHPAHDKKFNRKVKQEQFDILHTHSPFTMGMFAIRKGKKLNIPVVATLHTKYKEDFRRVLHGFKPFVSFMMHYIMRVYKRADSVWTVNDASCKILREYGYRGEIVVVRNGTDFSYPDDAQTLIERVNDRHDLFGKKNVFIFVGRIAMYKNLKMMADALKIVKGHGFDFTMLIIGSGFDEKKFRAIVDEYGLSENFIFTGSVSDRRLLQGYYLRSDLFLFPSTFDTSSLVPIEAAAHKLPTLLIKDSCTAENITGDFNGFLAEENAESYARKIEEIILDPDLRTKVGEEAYRSVYRNWETVAEEVLQNYRRVIEDFQKKKSQKK